MAQNNPLSVQLDLRNYRDLRQLSDSQFSSKHQKCRANVALQVQVCSVRSIVVTDAQTVQFTLSLVVPNFAARSEIW